jgi:hypothetical protein
MMAHSCPGEGSRESKREKNALRYNAPAADDDEEDDDEEDDDEDGAR